jgi:hypothetical protein
MRISNWKCFAVVALGLLGAGQAAWAASNSPESLDEARLDAVALIGTGQRLEAANLLLRSLREIPPERPDLALGAVGVVQALLFDTEYLMQPGERKVFFTQSLDETGHPMDLLLATLMRYSDDAGITVDEAERCVQDLYRLTRSENRVVRLGALFTMSSPYFLYDTGWAQTARDRIVKEFPGTELALEAQRLPLYRAEQFGPDGLDLIFNAANQKDELRAHSQRLREDAIGAAVYSNLEARGGARDDVALANTLAAAAASAPGWMEQYAALSILADLDPDTAGARVREAASSAIARNTDSRVAFRARTLRLLLARKSGDAATLLEDTGALLDLGDLPLVPERNNYEELMHHVRQSAARLAELGKGEEAQALLRRLADRAPGSALAGEVEETINSIAEPGAGDAGVAAN